MNLKSFRIFKGLDKPNAQSNQLRAQVDSSIEMRTESLLGREYLVVPVIAMVEGVRFGANAESPELGLASEFSQDIIMWANRPLVLNHPQTEYEGEMIYCSANSADILEEYSFGMTMNPFLEDGKLKMEAWIDTVLVEEKGGEFSDIVASIQAEETVEISVGFFSTLEPKKGKFRGQSYGGIWRNIKPDHLAILSIGTLGACSIEDGCGIPRINQTKEANVAKPSVPSVSSITVDKPNPTTQEGDCGCGHAHEPEHECTCGDHMPEITDLKAFEEHLAAEDTAKRDEVRAFNSVLISQSVSGTLTDSDVRTLIQTAMRKQFPKSDVYLYAFTQDKAIFSSYSYVDGSYGYRTYQIGINVSDTKAEFVGEAEEVVLLTKIVPQSKQPADVEEQPTETDPPKENDMSADSTTQLDPNAATTTPAPEAAPVAQAAVVQAPLTAQAYLDQAPAELREMLASGLKLHADKKAGLVATIVANAGNKFSEDQLKAFDLGMLENLAALAGVETPNYSGTAAPRAFALNDQAAEAIPTPPRLFAVK